MYIPRGTRGTRSTRPLSAEEKKTAEFAVFGFAAPSFLVITRLNFPRTARERVPSPRIMHTVARRQNTNKRIVSAKTLVP